MKKILFIAFICLISISSSAQIAYQVALLNKATGEPRANETVSAQVELTGSDGKTYISETKNVTSNAFGLLSFTIGNTNSFDDVDWSKALPLFVSVSVDGTLIGKSQVMNVPVAEYAKNSGRIVTTDILESKTWTCDNSRNNYKDIFYLTFSGNKVTLNEISSYGDDSYSDTRSYSYIILDGCFFYLYDENGEGEYHLSGLCMYIKDTETIIQVGNSELLFK